MITKQKHIIFLRGKSSLNHICDTNIFLLKFIGIYVYTYTYNTLYILHIICSIYVIYLTNIYHHLLILNRSSDPPLHLNNREPHIKKKPYFSFNTYEYICIYTLTFTIIIFYIEDQTRLTA